MMESVGYSYVNKSFVEDVNDDLNENVTHNDDEKLVHSIADECISAEILYLNLCSEEKTSDSGSESYGSSGYIDVNIPKLEGNGKQRCSSCLDVSIPRSDTLPNTERKKIQKNRFSLCSVHNYVDLEEIKEDLKNPKKRSTRKSRKARDKSKNLQLLCSGITVVDEDKIVVVTKTGEILLFKNTGCITYLAEFLETFEDVTSLSTTEIAASCGFCIKFYDVGDRGIQELEDKCIDYQHSGETTVHALHFVHNIFLITCNIQTCLQFTPFIRIIDKKGHVLKNFVIPSIHSPGHISSTDDGKLIFLTDQALKKVVAIDDCGAIKWEVETDHVPHYVSACGRKSVVVSCERELELKRFSLSGKPLSPVGTRLGPISAPFLVSFFPENDTLFFCSEVHHHYDREFVYSVQPKKSKLQKFKKIFKK